MNRPANNIAFPDINDQIQTVMHSALYGCNITDVPRPHLIRSRGNVLIRSIALRCPGPTAVNSEAFLAHDPVISRFRAYIQAFFRKIRKTCSASILLCKQAASSFVSSRFSFCLETQARKRRFASPGTSLDQVDYSDHLDPLRLSPFDYQSRPVSFSYVSVHRTKPGRVCERKASTIDHHRFPFSFKIS